MPLNDPKLKEFMDAIHREHLPTINKHVFSAMKNPMKPDHITHSDLHQVALKSLHKVIADYNHETAASNVKPDDKDHPFTKMLNSQLKYSMMNALKPKTGISDAHYKKGKKSSSKQRAEQSGEVKTIDPASIKTED